jgi:energy-coupling factor transporter ATP-binding protein EcfA2
MEYIDPTLGDPWVTYHPGCAGRGTQARTHLCSAADDDQTSGTKVDGCMTPTIAARDAHKSFGYGRIATPILGGISLEKAHGESVFLIGPSGSGKITHLSLLGSILTADRGSAEELDSARVRVGQSAVVTADGLPGHEFRGKVSLAAPRMGKRVLRSDAPGEYKDLYFREVMSDLDAGTEQALNLRVRARIQVVPTEVTR